MTDFPCPDCRKWLTGCCDRHAAEMDLACPAEVVDLLLANSRLPKDLERTPLMPPIRKPSIREQVHPITHDDEGEDEC